MLFDFDGSQVNILIAFFSGVGAFFASCFFPLLPMYLGYLSGEMGSTQQMPVKRRPLLIASLAFSFGFFFSFTALAVLLAQFSYLVASYKVYLHVIAGILTILIGLMFLGIIRWTPLLREYHFSSPKWAQKSVALRGFLLGAGIAWGWSPCIGPVLAVILFWIANQNNLAHAIFLLLAFSAGITIPFTLFGISFDRLNQALKGKIQKFGSALRIIGGITMIIMGTWLLFTLW